MEKEVKAVQDRLMLDAGIPHSGKTSLTNSARKASWEVLDLLTAFDKTMATTRELAGVAPEELLSWFDGGSKGDNEANRALRSRLTDWFPLAFTEGTKADVRKRINRYDTHLRFVRDWYSEQDHSADYGENTQIRLDDVLKLHRDLEVKRAAFVAKFIQSNNEASNDVVAASSQKGAAMCTGSSDTYNRLMGWNALVALANTFNAVITLRNQSFELLLSDAQRLDHLSKQEGATEEMDTTAKLSGGTE
jgi:hypothetical protein